jgi:hypothetical protein
MDIDSTIISTAFSILISTPLSILITRSTNKNQTKESIHNEITIMIQLAIEYPFLEQDSFCSAYNGNRECENNLRYDNYCCIVFNILEKIFVLFGGKRLKIEEFIGIKEIALRHKQWWKSRNNQKDIIDGYRLEFVEFIDSYHK